MKTRVQRLLSGLLACCLVCTVLTWNAEAAGVCGFRDVPANHWAASSIQRCVELGLFQGESATTFGVGHEMNRAGFTVVLAQDLAQPFRDVTTNTGYIAMAYELGLVQPGEAG